MSAWPSPTYAALSHSDAIASLIEHGRPWRGVVHSEFRSVLNIATEGALIAVAAPSAGRLPNGVAADMGPDFRRLGIRAGMVVEHGPGTLSIDEAGVVIDLSRTEAWSPRLAHPTEGTTESVRRWRARASAIRRLAATVTAGRAGAGRGLGPLVGPWPEGSRGDLADRARPVMSGLRKAVRDRNGEAAATMARALIGLGPGLTPSGDDALVGVAAACHALGSPVSGFLADALVDVDARTTAIAASYLRHAGRGEFAERIHVLLADLLGSDVSRIEPVVRAFVNWGASSGTDCLVGVLLGLDAVADTGAAA